MCSILLKFQLSGTYIFYDVASIWGDFLSEKIYTIKDLSKMTGIKITTIRKYENDFNLKIPRNEMRHRYYTDREIAIYRQIKKMKDKGASTELIKNILEKSVDVIEQKEQAMELVTIDRLTGAELKEVMIKQVGNIMQEREENLKREFERMLLDQEQKIREQIKAENQKLMNYIEEKRQENKGFWSKLFRN